MNNENRIGETVYILDNSYTECINSPEKESPYLAGQPGNPKGYPAVPVIIASAPYNCTIVDVIMGIRHIEVIDVVYDDDIYRVLNLLVDNACYKTGLPCRFHCSGICKDSY